MTDLVVADRLRYSGQCTAHVVLLSPYPATNNTVLAALRPTSRKHPALTQVCLRFACLCTSPAQSLDLVRPDDLTAGSTPPAFATR